MNDAEVSLVLELTRLLKLGVSALLLKYLVDKGLVSGFREPALLIQQSEDARWVSLRRTQPLSDTDNRHTVHSHTNIRAFIIAASNYTIMVGKKIHKNYIVAISAGNNIIIFRSYQSKLSHVFIVGCVSI